MGHMTWKNYINLGLKLKEQRRISQAATDNIIEGCKGLFAQTIDHVKAGVRVKLAETGR